MRYLIAMLFLAGWASTYGQTVNYEKVSEKEFMSLAFRSNFQDEEGTMWLGTRNEGIYRWKGNDYHRLTFSDSLSSMNGAASITKDTHGFLYFTGRNVGILNTKTGGWSQLTDENLKSTVVFNARVQDNVTFFAGNRGVSVLSQHEGVLFLDDSLATVYPVVHDLAIDDDRRFWLATRKGGLIVLNNAKDGWDQYYADANCRKIFESSNGDIWIGSTKGLIHYRPANETFKVLREEVLLFPDFEDDKGNLWTSSESEGIWIYDGESWSQMSTEGSYGVFSLENGSVWSSTKKGLIKLK